MRVKIVSSDPNVADGQAHIEDLIGRIFKVREHHKNRIVSVRVRNHPRFGTGLINLMPGEYKIQVGKKAQKQIKAAFDYLKTQVKYYEFTLVSSKGTNQAYIRRYLKEPTKEQLKEDLENWADDFAAMHVSENHCTLAWRELKGKDLPKNRKQLLIKYERACKELSKAAAYQRRLANLLAVEPYRA